MGFKFNMTFLYWKGLLCVTLVIWAGQGASSAQINVDMTGSGCDHPNGYSLDDNDIMSIYHMPLQNGVPTRDDCFVTIRTEKRRRLEYIIETLSFEECGVTIYIYDNPDANTNPKQVFTCSNTPRLPITQKTNYNVLKIHIRKTEVNTEQFQFGMKLKNDYGPDIGTRIDENNYVGEAIDPGAIAGIAIAGVIVIIALILLAIYFCVRARSQIVKDGASSTKGESSVYTSGNSQVLFASGQRYPKGRYGSMEDIRSTTSSQDKANGAYANQSYTAEPGEERSERQASFGRAKGKATSPYYNDDKYDLGGRGKNKSWAENEEDAEVRIGSFRKSRKDSFNKGEKKLKSAMKKPQASTDMEMNKVSSQPNGILKAPRRNRSPNRSHTSSVESSVDSKAVIYGYNRSTTEHPNVKHKPVIERRRSRSGTRSNRSGSSGGSSHHRRSQSADRKPKPKHNSRMYGDVFIQDDSRARSSSRSRARSNSLRSRKDRGSDSVDSESSATSSRRVNTNPGGKRVHIKGEETDI